MLLTLLFSKSFGNILKLQSTFTNIKTLEGLELQLTCFRRKCCFSLFRYIIEFNPRIFPNLTASVAYKGVCWFCELLQILLTFCLFSCIELANASCRSFILDKQCCKNALRPRMIVQCHWWSIALQLKVLRLFFFSPPGL